MEYVTNINNEPGRIACCQCGALIEPNAANMCVACLRSRVDITEGIPKQVTIYFCKGCERYLHPPSQWLACALESRELLGLCLKRLKGLNQARLIDAGFVWTEPHSKRIKVKLTIQKEVMSGAILQQVFIVEYTVNNQMCEDCHRVEAKDFWKALVQVRQKVSHKKTFYYLEQRILKHQAHTNTLNIKPRHDGLDFFYATKDHAKKMVDFIVSVIPCRSQMSQQLISHDIHSNIFNYKFTFSVEIAPVCKDDVVCLPRKLAHQLGGIGQICIVQRVTNLIHLIDPFSTQVVQVDAGSYWRDPFVTICDSRHLIEYTVMNMEIIPYSQRPHFTGQGSMSEKHALADIWVVKSSELGINDSTIHCRTHLAHLLKIGDSVLGFDVQNTNVNETHFEQLKRDYIPDVVIVKKLYVDKAVRNRRRKWKLKRISDDLDESASKDSDRHRDFHDFMDDLEEDPLYRKDINIFKDPRKIMVEVDEAADEEYPQITLQEMLDELSISEDGTGGEGAAMME